MVPSEDPLEFWIDPWRICLKISAKIKTKNSTEHRDITREKNTYLITVVKKGNPSRTEKKK